MRESAGRPSALLLFWFAVWRTELRFALKAREIYSCVSCTIISMALIN
jgi:hypothetical protein